MRIAEIHREVREGCDPAIVKELQAHSPMMSRAQWQAMKKDGDEIPRALAVLMDGVAKPGDAHVQRLIDRHHVCVGQVYTVTPETSRVLGQMYVEDSHFCANNDKYCSGLSNFRRLAMEYFCDRMPKR